MDHVPDFYLASGDSLILEKPRECFVIKRLKSEARDDLLLLRIDPPIRGKDFTIPINKIEKVAVANHFDDILLFPITRWPVPVYVLAVLIDNPEQESIISNDQMKLIAWAELYETLEEANSKKFTK
jgi:hypothetical protein